MIDDVCIDACQYGRTIVGLDLFAVEFQNELDAETSYFVKVEGYPESIIFGAYSVEDAAEVFVVRLK